MMTKHFEFWPKRLAKSISVPKTSLCENLEVSARRYPENIAIRYYGGSVTYGQFKQQVDALAGLMQKEFGIEKGDRVLLFMQNSPQFMIGYYAILRANAVVVPVNPMYVTEEVAFYLADCQAKAALVAQELYERIAPLQGTTSLKHVVVAAYSDYISPEFELSIPEDVQAPRKIFANKTVTYWQDAISCGITPGSITVTNEDLAVLPYTSGTTGKPKGCMHTHGTVNVNAIAAAFWNSIISDSVALTTLPLFHVTGMQHSMNAPIFYGATMVLLTRWDRDLAASLIERYGCTHWMNIATMVIDFLANPKLEKYNLSSLGCIGGGGAALPEAIGEKLFQLVGVRYAEGYGLSETISQTHMNPPDRPKLQCLGVPAFDVDARIIDPETLEELGSGQQGEIVVNGPQVLKGYWNRPQETKEAFVSIEGKQFFRTGDIAKYDEDGYFFMVDRVKRMINASGFKVWPTEVESILYKHPAIQQACVIGIPDARRGENVKAFVILHESEKGKVAAEEIIEWAKGQMAAYKYPRIVEFVDRFPTTASGKILWRKLQEDELIKLKKLKCNAG